MIGEKPNGAQPEIGVVPFPLEKRVGHIRRTADRVFNCRTAREAEAYWRRAVVSLHRQMEKAGVSEERIEREILAFHSSVQTEMGRLARQPYQPEDAA